mmetsp:Transcript_44449/g.48108  ORF Transcript_44449/g.48108 Transcript_44449/m.48108 type:complete len:225 (+) Transcript_44449:43-717(+)
MGKKSKRKGNNVPTCYHGLSKKEFNCGEHHKILDRWDNKVDAREFLNKNDCFCFMSDTAFATFIIAHVTTDYLKGKDDAILKSRLLLLLHMRNVFIPKHEGNVVGPESEYTKNYHKYLRDVTTERGRINIMAREIPCDCMEAKRIEAKLMDKVAICFGCKKEFLKEELLRCKRCDYAQYCSKKCSKKHWARHKEFCRKFVVSPAPKPESLSSSFGKPSYVDVDV